MIQDDNGHQKGECYGRTERSEWGQTENSAIGISPIIASLEPIPDLSDRLSPFPIEGGNRRAFINFQAPPGHRYS